MGVDCNAPFKKNPVQHENNLVGHGTIWLRNYYFRVLNVVSIMLDEIGQNSRVSDSVIFFLCFTSVSFISYSRATEDVEIPEEKLKYLHLLLTVPEFVSDVSLYALRGCDWVEETVWLGSGWKSNAGDIKYAGGLGIKFRNKEGEAEWLSYLFTWNKSKDRLENIRRDKKSRLTLEC